MDEGAQTSRYKISKSWGRDAQHGAIINTILYLKVAKKVDPYSSHHKKNIALCIDVN